MKVNFCRTILMQDYVDDMSLIKLRYAYEDGDNWISYRDGKVYRCNINLPNYLGEKDTHPNIVPNICESIDFDSEDDIVIHMLLSDELNLRKLDFILEEYNKKWYNSILKIFEDKDLMLQNFFMNKNTYSYLKERIKPEDYFYIDEETTTMFYQPGFLEMSNLYTFDCIPDGWIILTSSPEYCGVIAVDSKEENKKAFCIKNNGILMIRIK